MASSSIVPLASFTPFVIVFLAHVATPANSVDPTKGFVAMPLTKANFDVRTPYNLPQSARYRLKNNTHNFWLHESDQPFTRSSPTHPRAEIRIMGYDYTKGTWQFEGMVRVAKGTTGVCVMQVFGAVGHPTTLMLKVCNKGLCYYGNRPALADDILGRWTKINVIHNTHKKTIRIFINNKPAKEAPNRTTTRHWIQFGLYMQEKKSPFMETEWKRIRILKKE